MPMDTAMFEIPSLRRLARHALPSLLEATAIPMALFYCVLPTLGLWPAIASSLLWSYTAVGRRLLTGRRVPGVLILAVALATARTAVAAADHSAFLYFVQPVLATALVGLTFLGSAALGRPLTERLAADLIPFPEGFLSRPQVRRFFTGIAVLWGVNQLANAGVTLWLLTHEPLDVFVVAHNVASWTLAGISIGVSTLWFRVAMARAGLLLPRPATDLPTLAQVQPVLNAA
jgi:uncharacterized membrane protein